MTSSGRGPGQDNYHTGEMASMLHVFRACLGMHVLTICDWHMGPCQVIHQTHIRTNHTVMDAGRDWAMPRVPNRHGSSCMQSFATILSAFRFLLAIAHLAFSVTCLLWSLSRLLCIFAYRLLPKKLELPCRRHWTMSECMAGPSHLCQTLLPFRHLSDDCFTFRLAALEHVQVDELRISRLAHPSYARGLGTWMQPSML